MKRRTLRPRENWQTRVEALGLVYHSVDDVPYWDESVCYEFSSAEIDELESATEELQRRCLDAGQFILDNDLFEEFGIPSQARDCIRRAWDAEPPSIYGRFDLSYDGVNPPKLLEYNADTPTGLLEAAVVQWDWRQEVFPATDQFNSVHEKLIDKWSELKRYLPGGPVHFTCMPNDEDLMTVTYLRDTAEQAGLRTKQLFVRDLGWRADDSSFRDLQEQPIKTLFKLYPWEWFLQDAMGKVIEALPNCAFIEPIWKVLWSNKALLVTLWKLFPDHPNLLPAYLDQPREMKDYVKKPLLSREGANVTLRCGGHEIATDGPYGGSGYVYQALAPGWSSSAENPVIGSWYITDRGPAGIGIREGKGIVNNTSRFVPHYFA